ncbi:glutaredoxin domain-containing cysteine-rich protein 1-like [Petromyzon marinus]|uniref:glutaredoxin domain-containing cysteine-rich protein 1-like n=1 Tax=Petromyzon marinus TaxID=7757 RepID=UPI003F70BC0B
MGEKPAQVGEASGRVRFRVSSSHSGRVLQQVYEERNGKVEHHGATAKDIEEIGAARTSPEPVPGGYQDCLPNNEQQQQQHQEPGDEADLILSSLARSTPCFRRSDILSKNGTVRGVRHKVSAAQAHFGGLADTRPSAPRPLEIGKLVVYTTSVRVVRSTFERCEHARRILHTHHVHFEDRDVALHAEYVRDLRTRHPCPPSPADHRQLPNGASAARAAQGPRHDQRRRSGDEAQPDGASGWRGPPEPEDVCRTELMQLAPPSRDPQQAHGTPLELPAIFINGDYFGGADRLMAMNESGELRAFLRQFKRNTAPRKCAHCGGYRFVPCLACRGSKVSQVRTNFGERPRALRCTSCNENGLQRCTECTE